MTISDLSQGDLALLDHPVARELLDSAFPARLGYMFTKKPQVCDRGVSSGGGI